MTSDLLLIPILLPLVLGALALLVPGRWKLLAGVLALLGTAGLLYVDARLFTAGDLSLSYPWVQGIIQFDLRLAALSRFILLWIGIFGFLICLYSLVKMRKHARLSEFYGYYLFTLAAAAGAVMADNLLVLLFFWEGLLPTLYLLLSLGNKNSPRTALKGLLITAVCDFCLVLGVCLLWMLNGSASMSLPAIAPRGLAAASFLLMIIGAAGKAGAMPFHTWIPDAGQDSPVTVMAFLPASLDKLLGIYLLARICLDFFALEIHSSLSIILMAVGAVTIVLADLMTFIQKDYKKLLSFCAISQVGYMILGIGTATPIGIAGGIFHMVNHAIYKSGLFLGAGSIEHRTGTTDMQKLGGLLKEMPFTALGFLVCAMAVSGIWPLNGFVSKEMIFHGSLETGSAVFAVAAWFGVIFTFASFLKAGHAIFLGPRTSEIPPVKESEGAMLLPILTLGFFCILFGVANSIPLNAFIQPVLQGSLPAGELPDLTSHALDVFTPVALVSIAMLAAGFFLYLFGWYRAQKQAYLASEVIHRIPVLHTFYRWSEERRLDLYEQGVKILEAFSNAVFRGIDRPIDAVYERGVVGTGKILIRALRSAHNGFYPNYLAWCLAGLVALLVLVWIF
jgi:NADH:ubiquinone oxidoreductase subunit 5 (subunit L)/multisubunit Na+/H+ antiporter MnhA subunit